MKKRKHHYIWRNYLRAWALNEQISCLRNGKPIEPNLMGIGVEKDFYKLKELTAEDLEFIKNFAIDPAVPRLQQLHNNLVKQFNFVYEFKKKVEISGSSQKTYDEIDIAIHNLEEDLHCEIENAGIKYLKEILQHNINFYYNADECAEFLYYLSVQYFRTKRMKVNVINTIKIKNPGLEGRFERIWNLLSRIFAMNIGYSLYTERSKYNMILLQNKSAKEFITSDQPVINTCAQDNPTTPPDDIELYYPVSPRLAILLTKIKNDTKINQLELNEKEVTLYNKLMVENSNEQLYATSLSFLQEYLV